MNFDPCAECSDARADVYGDRQKFSPAHTFNRFPCSTTKVNLSNAPSTLITEWAQILPALGIEVELMLKKLADEQPLDKFETLCQRLRQLWQRCCLLLRA